MDFSLPDKALALNGVDSAYLDCYSNNLATMLAYLGVEDIRTPFAYHWFFDFDPDQKDGLPHITDGPIEAAIYQQTGHSLLSFPAELAQIVPICCELQRQYGFLLVLGDAYLMPWLPYFEHEHMLHSFTIVGVDNERALFHVVDAYHNQTEWGEALPTELWLPMSSIESIVASAVVADKTPFRVLQKTKEPETPNIPALLRGQAEHMLHQYKEKQTLLTFCQYYRKRANDVEAVKRFCLACWLVARQRALYHLWLNDLTRISPAIVANSYSSLFQQLVSAPWQKLREFSYILLRRVKLGRQPVDTCFQMLEDVIFPGECQAATLLLQELLPISQQG